MGPPPDGVAMSRLVSVGCMLFASIGSAACSEHTIVIARPSDVVTLEKSRVQTFCAANNERRRRDCSRCESGCYDLVLQGCDPTSVCRPICTPELCTDEAADTKCEKTAWTAHVSLTATPGVEAACQKAYADSWAQCGGQPTDEDVAGKNEECANAALIDAETGVAYYACLGASACGKLAADCEQASTLGDEVCAMRGASCTEAPCNDASRAGLNDIGSHLKPAMLAAAKTCLSQSTCDDVGACMREWWKLID